MPKSLFDQVQILVVEDNAFMRDLLRNVLQAMTFENTHTACNGAEALDMMHRHPPDIVLTDARMAPVDGYEFALQVRTGTDSPNPFVPIIMVTGHHDRHSVELARDCGVNEYLVKPVTPAGLYSRISQTVLRPRLFVKSERYFGPDRRRRRAGPGYDGPYRRTTDLRIGPPRAEEIGFSGGPRRAGFPRAATAFSHGRPLG